MSDLNTLLVVQRTGSVSGAARELKVTPSQVSKAIARLERHFAVRLLCRSARGVVPTAAGRHTLPRIAQALEELRATADAGTGEVHVAQLTIAGPAYLVAHVMPALIELVPTFRLRSVELAPAHLRSCLADDFFDVALAPGGLDNPPAAWACEVLRGCRSALLARPAFAKVLGPLPLAPDRIRSVPFVGPATISRERFAAIGDDCPLPPERRTIAHEAHSVASALEVAAHSDYLVFCPVLAASRFIETGLLIELPVVGWDVTTDLHILCNRDRVLSRVQQAIVRVSTEMLQLQFSANHGRSSSKHRRVDEGPSVMVSS